MKSILLVKKHLELVEMMFGLVNAGFSLPEWQKMILWVHLTRASDISRKKKQNFAGFSGANSRKNRPISRDLAEKKSNFEGFSGANS